MRPAATITAISLFAAVLIIPHAVEARSKRSLEDDGWRVVAQGTVRGAFDGCVYDKPVPLDGDFIFVCRGYSYHYAYRPDFFAMQRNGAEKYVIDDEEFDGVLYRGTVVETHVKGEFEGCDFDKLIALDNGLVFECRTYHYHYAYRPQVVITNFDGAYRVTIDGELYSGQLFRR